MRFIAVTPTKDGKNEAKSMYLVVENIRSFDSEITEPMHKALGIDERTKTMIELYRPKNGAMTVSETVQEIMQAIREAEDI